ncbi:MAG: DUF4159 domain-containing protein [Planctomycetota bacterium]|nr:MAG: DUF4159 domain-containing protein [Planctomycetota bacterium]
MPISGPAESSQPNWSRQASPSSYPYSFDSPISCTRRGSDMQFPRTGTAAILPVLPIVLLTALVACQPAKIRAQGVDAQSVERAIDQAIRFQLSGQRPDGGWPEYNQQYPRGVSCLVALSLLTAGLDPDHPNMQRALRYVDGEELERTYTVALQTMVYCAANPNRYAAQIRRNTVWLMKAQVETGAWTYGRGWGGGGDPSNTQFALLALHEAQRSGVVDLPQEEWLRVFERAARYWNRKQNRDGSFSYDDGKDPSGSMTCAGIASLVILGEHLDALQARGGDIIQCCGNEFQDNDRIEAGLAWLARNFDVRSNPGMPSYHLYYMYALERVGRLTGNRYIGRHDWYREGAEYLVRLQNKTVGKIVTRNAFQGNEYSETAFALLFLAKGKRQTLISRGQYASADPGDWNRHPMAIQHLTAHTERAWKRDLSWQNVDLASVTTAELLETPVLFLSGTRTPRLSNREKQLLKEYVEQGGFIFAEGANGDGCDGRQFEDYFRQLVLELFESPLEKLPPEHPIWFAEARVRPADLPPGAWLYGVQTCCRLGVVYVPYSLSCRWELHLPYGKPPAYSPEVRSQLETATKIGINVLAYATGKDLKEKLDTVTVLEEVRDLTPTDRNVFFLPVLRHNAGYDDAPRATTNLIEWMHKENPFRLSSQKRYVEITTEDLARYPIVFMHGRGELRLTEQQREVLRDYLKNGGFIFADSICADPAFTASFRREMQLVLGRPLEPLDPQHPMLTPDYYGFDVRRVSIIDPDAAGENIVAAKRVVAPQLEVGQVEGRLAVVFSPLDISCALESRHSLQCRGYTREDAARLSINVLMFALQQ